VPNFAETAKPLTALTRKNHEFAWGPSQQEAFDSLKRKLSTTPVLAFPNFSLPFILTTDASKVAVAAVLSQIQDGIERPIAFASRQKTRLNNRTRRPYPRCSHWFGQPNFFVAICLVASSSPTRPFSPHLFT